MHILGIIPARGNSKGIPGKNLISLAGKPLIAHTITEAKKSTLLTRFVVSTEDEKIAGVARAEGAEVPFVRPAELSTDDALTFPVILHALKEMERQDNVHYDIIVLLQVTTPLRTAADIDAGIRLLLDKDAESVVSIVDVEGNHPCRMKLLHEDGHITNYIDQGFEDMRPRQQLPPVYIRSGALYVTRRAVVLEQGRLVGNRCYGLVLPAERAVNIDRKLDLYVAERLLADKP